MVVTEPVGNFPNSAWRAGQFTAAASISTDTDTKIVSSLAAVSEFANAFNGAAGVAAPFAGGVQAAPLTLEQRALQGFPGAGQTALAKATYAPPASFRRIGSPTQVGASAEESLFDYTWRQVSEADFSTPANRAAFYTGYRQGNFTRATAWADANGGFLIDRTPGGAWLNDLTYGAKAEFSIEESDSLWSVASARYASGASGDVHVFASGVAYDPKRVLYSVELPILRQNSDVHLIWH
jgi:hypothetical protein